MLVSESHLSQVVGQNPLLEEVTAVPGHRCAWGQGSPGFRDGT